MTYSYEDCVIKYSGNFKRILIDREYISKIENFVAKIVAFKNKEDHHIVDSNKESKRFMTGFMGEAAIEKLFGIQIIDWTIGNSSYYHHPDIPGYNVGIKTVEKGKFPIIFKQNKYPQIICIRSDYRDDLVFVCGLATADVLNRCQSDTLVLDPRLQGRGTKTGFWGFNELTQVSSLDDIFEYRK